MPPAKKRKIAKPASEATTAEKPEAVEPVSAAVEDEAPNKETAEDSEAVGEAAGEASATVEESAPAPATEAGPSSGAKESSMQDRMARFRSLQARSKDSSSANMKEATKESQRLASDPAQLVALGRKHAIASHKLLKAEVEEGGGDFERKRAWDWTIEESEAWDKRMAKKVAHRDDAAFQDYRRDAQKVYKRQVRQMGPVDMEKYAKEKMAAIEKAAAAGTLEIVETEDGELIAVDKDGSFYSTSDSTAFAESKPDRAAVDRLVNDLKKAEEISAKKRRERMAANGDDADVTYINEKNKQFNQKLARFYNKYTAEIRDSFERGTMI